MKDKSIQADCGVCIKDFAEMHLADLPFEQIQNGQKTIEVRLFDDKRKNLKVGERIAFYRSGGSEFVIVKIISLIHEPTFKQFFALPNVLQKAGFADYSIDDAVNCMYRYYYANQEAQYGVLGIEIEVIPFD